MKSLTLLLSTRVSALSVLAGSWLFGIATPAHAQGADETESASAEAATPASDGEDDGEPAPTPTPAPAATLAGKPVKTAQKAAAPEQLEQPEIAQPDYQLERPNGYVTPQAENTLAWHGSLEADTAYASYSFDANSVRPQHFYDMRGRFVVGPTVEYRFGEQKAWFVAARGELVAWLRETNTYQVNADDVYAQFGLKNVWDFKLGRFRSWRVYHKGNGFDLYTIEDVGACGGGSGTTGSCSLESGTFGPHTYEVSHIYDREPAGRVALHAYPTPWSGIEVLGTLGNNGVTNVLGGRGAALVHFPYFRVSGAGEYRLSKPGQEQAATDPMTGATSQCTNCNVNRSYGYGGSLEVTLEPFAAALNAAQSHETKYSPTNGTLDRDGSATRTSLGGYAELDVGTLAFDRSLVLGFGLNRTEVVDQVDNFEQHYQGAAYVLFPLGFNAASVKLVLSQATLDIQKANGDGTATALPTSMMRAARVRLTYPF